MGALSGRPVGEDLGLFGFYRRETLLTVGQRSMAAHRLYRGSGGGV